MFTKFLSKVLRMRRYPASSKVIIQFITAVIFCFLALSGPLAAKAASNPIEVPATNIYSPEEAKSESVPPTGATSETVSQSVYQVIPGSAASEDTVIAKVKAPLRITANTLAASTAPADIVVSTFGNIFITSDNGKTFRSLSPNPNYVYVSLAASADTLVAVGQKIGSFSDYRIFVTKDGINWSNPVSVNTMLTVALYGNGRFVVTGGELSAYGSNFFNDMFTSTDGLNWTQVPFDGYIGGNGTFADGKFMYVSHSGNETYLHTSTNGTSWSKKTISQDYFFDIAYGGGKYVAVGRTRLTNNLPLIGYSTDGTTFTNKMFGYQGKRLSSVAYGNGMFVAVGSGGMIAYSSNGSSWTDSTINGGKDLYEVTYDSNRGSFLVVGDGYLQDITIANNSIISGGIHASGASLFAVTLFQGTSLDRIAPVTKVALNPLPNGSNGWHRTGLTFSLTATDNASGVARIEYVLNNGTSWIPYSGPVAISQEGIYTLYFRSVDKAGNIEAYQSIIFGIDKTPPVTSAVINPSSPNGTNGWYVSDPTISLSVLENLSGIAASEYRINNGTWNQYNGFIEGTNTVQFKSTDGAGNVEAVKSITFKLDKTTPVTVANLESATPGENGVYTSDVIVSFSASDAVSGVNKTEYQINGGAWTTYTGSLPPIHSGTYTITYRTVDLAGNMETTKSVTFTVVSNRPPVLQDIGNQTVNEGDPLQFNVFGTDPDGDALTYTSLNLPAGATFDPATGIFRWTPDYTQAGTYSGIQFQVSDGDLSDSKTITITVVNVNRPPVLQDIGNQTVNEGDPLQFNVSGTDPDGDALTYTVLNLPAGATFDPATGIFRWTPDYTHAGTYSGIQFQVSDGNLSDSKTITITVVDVSPSSLLEQLIAYVQSLKLPSGIENSLITKLENAIKSIDKEKTAINHIESFINEVEAQSGKKIPTNTPNEILNRAHIIIHVINL